MAEIPPVRLTVTVEPASVAEARALREAAADLYGDDGPGHRLSTATWLRERAARIDPSADVAGAERPDQTGEEGGR